MEKYWQAVEKPYDRRFMLDLETTGVDENKDDILEVGILEVQWPFKHGQYWVPGHSFNFVFHNKRQPDNLFAKEQMAELYKLCNETPEENTIELCRIRMIDWLGSLGVKRPNGMKIMGMSIASLDIPFCLKHKLLEKQGYKPDPNDPTKEVATGDFHYRMHEQQGGIELCMKAIGYMGDRSAFVDMIREVYTTAIPEESPAALAGACKPHRALYDCYKQVDIENGLIHMLRHWK